MLRLFSGTFSLDGSQSFPIYCILFQLPNNIVTITTAPTFKVPSTGLYF